MESDKGEREREKEKEGEKCKEEKGRGNKSPAVLNFPQTSKVQ